MLTFQVFALAGCDEGIREAKRVCLGHVPKRAGNVSINRRGRGHIKGKLPADQKMGVAERANRRLYVYAEYPHFSRTNRNLTLWITRRQVVSSPHADAPNGAPRLTIRQR